LSTLTHVPVSHINGKRSRHTTILLFRKQPPQQQTTTTTMMRSAVFLLASLVLWMPLEATAFISPVGRRINKIVQFQTAIEESGESSSSYLSRRSFFASSLIFANGLLLVTNPQLAKAESEKRTLEDDLYLILRVREATQQEKRLINVRKKVIGL
jgi:hypothetical protein